MTLALPMKVAVRSWAKNQNAVSVDHGPLSSRWRSRSVGRKYGNRIRDWPEWEVFPDSPWNYGLVLDAQDPAKSFHVVRKPGPAARAAVHAGHRRRSSSKPKPARSRTGKWTA